MTMVLEEMREAARLVGRTPSLWIPGVVAGLLGAVLWILYNISGAFFAGRLVILSGLVMVLFVAGTFGLIRNNGTGAGTLLREGVRSFFRVLLPWLVIIFILVLVAILVTIVTIVTTGSSTDYTSAGILALIVMVPLLFMTFFCDTAAVFENLGVFKSLQRSIIVASTRGWEVLGFFIVSCAVAFIDLFFFAIVWEGLLFDKIQPLTTYNETQIASLTPQALVTLIGPDGIWVTAVVIFLAVVFLMPLLLAYKACFYRKLIGNPTASTPSIQQTTGEYDSKGRWYKY